MKLLASLTIAFSLTLAPAMASAAVTPEVKPQASTERAWRPMPFLATVVAYTDAGKVAIPLAAEAPLSAVLASKNLSLNDLRTPTGALVADRVVRNGENVNLLAVDYKGSKSTVTVAPPIKGSKVSWLPVGAFKVTDKGKAGSGVETLVASADPNDPSKVIETRTVAVTKKPATRYQQNGTATTKGAKTKCSNNKTNISSKAKGWVRLTHQASCRLQPKIKNYGSYRAGKGQQDHGTGTALDIMTYKNYARGDYLANYFVTHHKAFNIKYVIWKQRIWAPYRADEGWRKMENRGSRTANHFDHVHVSTY